MSQAVRMVIDDPSKFHLLTVDMKEQIIKGAIASVNVAAALARKEAIKNIRNNFTVRNNFTARQVQFTPMSQGRYALSAIHSTVGVTEKGVYMVLQETGGKRVARTSGKNLAIPTVEARDSNSRNVLRRQMRINSLMNRRIRRGDGRDGSAVENKALFLARVEKSFEKNRAVLMGKRKYGNLYKVVSFQRTNGGVKFKTKMLYKLDKKKTRVKAEPWFKPACEKVSRDVQKIFISQMKKLGM
jgi:hypothetical protein